MTSNNACCRCQHCGQCRCRKADNDMRIFIRDDGRLGYGSVLNRQQREQESTEKKKGNK